MKIELDIDTAGLIAKVSQDYSIEVHEIDFIPGSFVAFCYSVNCSNHDRYFLKLFDDSRLGRISVDRMGFYLPLTWELHSKNILPNIPYPIKTRDGRFSTEFHGHPIVLFNFIDGDLVGYENPMPDGTLAKLAGLVGITHGCRYQLETPFPFVENFGIPFESDLIDGLNALEKITKKDNWGKRELRELLQPRKDEILGYLNRLKELQSISRRAAKEMVLCHTDLHGGNLIMDDAGRLYILDWEGTILAPPQHDLFVFAWEDRFVDVFLPNYQRGFNPMGLNSDIFGFYYYRRNLEDLTDWIVRILYENTDQEQDRQDLDGIKEDCIEGWQWLEFTIGKIKAKLDKIDNVS
jgi:hypothetical protein